MKTRCSTIPPDSSGGWAIEAMPMDIKGKKVEVLKITRLDQYGQPVPGDCRLVYVPDGCFFAFDEKPA